MGDIQAKIQCLLECQEQVVLMNRFFPLIRLIPASNDWSFAIGSDDPEFIRNSMPLGKLKTELESIEEAQVEKWRRTSGTGKASILLLKVGD